MGGFAVKRSGGTVVDRKYHFSLLSVEDSSESENIDLPFNIVYGNERVYGGSCGGFLYFHGSKGLIVIYNTTTKEFKHLPPPKCFHVDPDDDHIPSSSLENSCLGYDSKSGDYKVIRICEESYFSDEDEGYNECFELYSFKRGSWKKIKKPDTVIHKCTGVYLVETGSCYWTATYNSFYYEEVELEATFGSSPDHPFNHVVWFDFATERFGQFPLPVATIGRYALYKLVECRGSLGALVYRNPDPEDDDPYDDNYELSPFSSSACDELSCIQLFVWKETLWDVQCVVSLVNVERPLCLKDDRLLFVEAKASGDRRCQLMVYDLDTRQLKKLDIYDYPRRMDVFSYAESTDPPLVFSYAESTDPPLPHSVPMTTMINFSKEDDADTEALAFMDTYDRVFKPKS